MLCRLVRGIRRWWARRTHHHDWVVIYRGVYTTSNWDWGLDGEKTNVRTRDYNAILECCTCGCERARYWRGPASGWQPLDIDWVSDQFARHGVDIPARHQE